MEEIIKIINSVGFPIAVCLIMIYQNFTLTTGFKNSIDNNTATIEKLLETLDEKENKE